MTPTETLAAAMATLGLTVAAEFVPFSKSRNKTKKLASLNWLVTIKRNGRDVLTTDYMAGQGHAPAYKATKEPFGYAGNLAVWKREAIAYECENGRKARAQYRTISGREPIEPDAVGVVWSLVQDASVLDSGGFEDWASEYGYDTDSRSAETTYRACLETSLKLRAAIGDAGLEALRTAGEDY